MGWIRDQYTRLQTYRAERFLTRHPDAGIAALRRDPDLGLRTMDAFLDQQAKGDGPQRDSYAYPVYMSYGYGGRSPVQRTLPKNTPYNIRIFSQYPPARRAIEALSNPLLQMPWAVTLRRPLGANLHEPLPEPTAEQQARIVAATMMLEQPNNEHNGHEFLEMLLEDLLVLGASPFEVEDNTSDERPLFLWPVDPQSIRINMQWYPGADTYRFSQGKGFLFGSIGISDDVHFEETQLCYPKLNSRTNTPFGYGYMEVAFDTVNSWFGAMQFATRRASNDIPPFGLFLGENMTPEQVRRFQHYWENEIEGYGKIPILGGGRQPTAFNFTTGNARDPLWISWQEYLIRVIAMSFGLSPMKLGLERDVNRSTASTQSADDWGTVAPLANILADAFTYWLFRKRLGWQDLEFQWQVRTADELRQAQILALQYANDAITVDELRQVYERPPLPDSLGTMTKTAYEAAVKMILGPPATPPQPPEDTEPPPGTQAPPIQASRTDPFGEIDLDDLSPAERAWMRETALVAATNGHGRIC